MQFHILRRQPDDFCQEYYDAWCQGRTGFPFVDACMRCLIDCGWLNFRMRAMLVSFATYNLWLDWKKIAGHLARVFLDYEPGIHYPQLQMQAGTTGINAMRVYNCTKQGKDQDPNGVFIRKYVPELRNVPLEYIHEPCNMPVKIQRKCGVIIGNGEGKNRPAGLGGIFQPVQQSTTDETVSPLKAELVHYPSPIVDEKTTAKIAKDKISTVRKQESTKEEAQKVYIKHGSRRTRNADRDGVKPKALSSAVKRVKVDKGQTSLLHSWKSASPVKAKSASSNIDLTKDDAMIEQSTSFEDRGDNARKETISRPSPMKDFFKRESTKMALATEWSCKICTFINEKPLALVCSMCGSIK